MDYLAEKETITIGPPPRCTGHDITLPGHVKTNVITLRNMSQSSYLTEIQTWLVSGYPRLMMPEKESGQHNLTRWSCKILGKWIMEASSESWVHHLTKERMRRWLMNSATIHWDFQDGFPHLCEQGDNICQIKWCNEVCSRKTYTVNHWLKGASDIWA